MPKKTKPIHLECTVCKNRNYRLMRGQDSKTVRLELKKYCKYCQAHTMHKTAS